MFPILPCRFRNLLNYIQLFMDRCLKSSVGWPQNTWRLPNAMMKGIAYKQKKTGIISSDLFFFLTVYATVTINNYY